MEELRWATSLSTGWRSHVLQSKFHVDPSTPSTPSTPSPASWRASTLSRPMAVGWTLAKPSTPCCLTATVTGTSASSMTLLRYVFPSPVVVVASWNGRRWSRGWWQARGSDSSSSIRQHRASISSTFATRTLDVYFAQKYERDERERTHRRQEQRKNVHKRDSTNATKALCRRRIWHTSPVREPKILVKSCPQNLTVRGGMAWVMTHIMGAQKWMARPFGCMGHA